MTTPKKPKSQDKFYSIKRCNSGYAIYDAAGQKVTEEDAWPMIIRKLEIILRKELGL